MPDDVGAHVVLDAALDEFVSLVLAVGAAVEDALHAEGLSMVRVVFEAGLDGLESLAVLLGLVRGERLAELFGERRREVARVARLDARVVHGLLLLRLLSACGRLRRLAAGRHRRLGLAVARTRGCSVERGRELLPLL